MVNVVDWINSICLSNEEEETTDDIDLDQLISMRILNSIDLMRFHQKTITEDLMINWAELKEKIFFLFETLGEEKAKCLSQQYKKPQSNR